MCNLKIIGSLYRYKSPMVSTDPNDKTAFTIWGYPHIYGQNRLMCNISNFYIYHYSALVPWMQIMAKQIWCGLVDYTNVEFG
jgi:hypothetical protein